MIEGWLGEGLERMLGDVRWVSSLSSLMRSWLRRLPKQTRTILLTVILGVGAGLVTVAFQVSMNVVYEEGLERLSRLGPRDFLIGSFALMILAGLVSGWLLHNYGKEAAGSGIPQLKAAFWKDFGYVSPRIIWVKFVAGVLQIGSGSSLGREGPSVQLAGAVASNLAGFLGEPKQRRRLGAATGAAAGLAAAFNTPLAAVTFVLEELVGDLNSRLLGSILLAGLTGALVVHGFLGPQPAFSLAPVGEPNWRVYLFLPVVAVLAALVGVVFQKGSMALRSNARRWTYVPGWARPSVGVAICWGLGVAVFLWQGRLGVFALGYHDLTDALAGRMTWTVAAILLGAKLLATIACYGTGGCGGIFAPTLFFGAMTGLAVAGAGQQILALPPDGAALLAIVGMSATLGAVVRAPVTSILIVFEMTHQFALVPPLMLAAIVAQAVSRRLLRHNFYDELLEQDGHDLDRFLPPRDLRSWQQQPLSLLANPRPVLATSCELEDLRRLLETHPYARFPVVIDGKLEGVLSRSEAQAALKQQRVPTLQEAVCCRPDERLHDAEMRLIESSAGMLLVQSYPGGPIEGLLTLHDLLRAQVAASERGDDGA